MDRDLRLVNSGVGSHKSQAGVGVADTLVIGGLVLGLVTAHGKFLAAGAFPAGVFLLVARLLLAQAFAAAVEGAVEAETGVHDGLFGFLPFDPLRDVERAAVFGFALRGGEREGLIQRHAHRW